MLRIREFAGRLPKLHPSMLPPGFAQTAENVLLRRGTLQAWRAGVNVDTVAAGSKVLGRIQGDWRGFAQATTTFIQGAVDSARTYVADGINPPRLINYGVYDRPLALEGPAAQPGVSIQSGTADTTAQNIQFVYTNVTDLGEESEPSPLSSIVKASAGMVIRLSGFSAYPAGRGCITRRFYRTVTVNGVADLHFLREDSTDSHQDFTISAEVQETISSQDYNPPPATLRGLTSMANGMAAGIVGDRTIYFAEPYQPHAWPAKYQLQTDSNIVGLATFGTTLAILTTTVPYTATGSHPDNIFMSRGEDTMPCLSARGIVDMGSGAAYPSTDGLVMISEGGAQIVTRGMFSRQEWADLNPSTFIATMYEGFYLFWHDPLNGPPQLGLIDLKGEAPFFTTVAIDVLDLVTEPTTGEVFGLLTDGTTVARLDAGARLTYVWRGGRALMGGLMNAPYGMALTEVEDESDTLEVCLYAGHPPTQAASFTTPNVPCRLPAGRLDQEFEVEIRGNSTVYMVAFTGSPEELVG